MPAYEVHAHEAYLCKMHAHEMDAHKMHAHEMHAGEMHPREVQINPKRPSCGFSRSEFATNEFWL